MSSWGSPRPGRSIVAGPALRKIVVFVPNPDENLRRFETIQAQVGLIGRPLANDDLIGGSGGR